VTGFVCTVNFSYICNKRGPQTFGNDQRLTFVQQLSLMQRCANNPPGRPNPDCLQVRWTTIVDGRVVEEGTPS
jgi:hypothetical protein